MGREASKTKVNENHVKKLDGRVWECFAQKFVWGVWILLQLQRPWRERHTEQNSFASWIIFFGNQNEWLWKDQFTCNISHLDHWYIVLLLPSHSIDILACKWRKDAKLHKIIMKSSRHFIIKCKPSFQIRWNKSFIARGRECTITNSQGLSHLLGFLHNKKERNARFLQG